MENDKDIVATNNMTEKDIESYVEEIFSRDFTEEEKRRYSVTDVLTIPYCVGLIMKSPLYIITNEEGSIYYFYELAKKARFDENQRDCFLKHVSNKITEQKKYR